VVEKVRGPSQSKFQGGGKVVKVKKPRTGAKGKKTLDYDSDNFSSLSNDSTPKQWGSPSRNCLKKTSRMNKVKVQEELKWTGEETNFGR